MTTQPSPPASSSFLRRHVAALGKEVHRLGLAASHGLDERGTLPLLDPIAKALAYNVITRRHEQRSLVITTNLSFKQWGATFPGAACVAALVDRFVQHCHILDIDADSWRQNEAEDFKPPRNLKSDKRPRREP